MLCFYHQDKEAVGTCKSCGKGLCPDCVTDLGKGLACRGRCERDVQEVIDLVDRNIKLQPTADRLIRAGGSARVAGSLFMIITGAVFIVFGLASDRQMGFIAILGCCFMAYGIFQALWSRRVATRPAEKRP